jgi:F0F1-type ATP synthase membrane subunit b/b'
VIRAILLALTIAAFAASGQEHAAAEHGAEHGDPLLPYKFLNFAVLAGGLGYLFVKVGVPALRGQQSAITESLTASARRAEEAAREAAAIEARMNNLDSELAGIRAKTKDELAAEAARLTRETEAQLAKVEQSTAMEIASAAKTAKGELKAYAAELALTLAAAKLTARLDAPAQARLADGFIQRLEARS